MRNIFTDNKVFDRISTRKLNILVVLFSAIFTLSAVFVSAQGTVSAPITPRPTATPYPRPTKYPTSGTITAPRIPATPPVYGNSKAVQNETGFPAEKSIEVDEKVNISLKVCDGEGHVKVNGWDRDEIRAYVKEGSEVGFNVRQKSSTNSKPVVVNVVGYDPQKNKRIGMDQCVSGEEIELDVPRGAILNIVAGQSSVMIESVNKASVKTIGGNISLNDIAQGIYAQTYGDGDVTVENSKGVINLNSTNGNILAFNLEPLEIGDQMSARTNGGGAITLQSIKHSQVESNSASGIIRLIGNISSGGQYRLVSTNGSIQLAIPTQSSCIINATYGNFQTEIPLKMDNISRNPNSQVQTRTVQIGSGDANLNLQTRGNITIKKSN